MRRFITITDEGNYTIEYDNHNKTYMVCIKCRGFRQQISKCYIYKGCAYRFLAKQLNKNTIKIKEN